MQGFRNYSFGDGIIWFYSHNFNLDPGPTQVYVSVIGITWSVKMLYGLIFDNFPIFKRHDKPYMFISTLISVFGFVGLRFAFFSSTPFTTALCFGMALMVCYPVPYLKGMAMSDVIADAMVVKKARAAGLDGGASLQTFCWVMMSVGSIIGRPLAGFVNGEDGSGSRTLLGTVYSLTACINVISAVWIKEEKGDVKWSISRTTNQIIRLFKAIFLDRKVLVPMSWIVMSAAIVPDTSAAMNFWKKDIISIGAKSQAYIDTVGDLFSIIGLLVYSNFYSTTSYRKIFFTTQLMASLFAFSDVILVHRWNISINIPDAVFLVGSQTIINTIYSLQGMPFLVMAAQLCPVDIEATFYAAMMSLSNTGGGISSLWGGYLLTYLHIVKVPNENITITDAILINDTQKHYDFTYLPTALWIRIFSMILPAFLVFCMIPDTAGVGDAIVYERFDGDGGDAEGEVELQNFDGICMEVVGGAIMGSDDSIPLLDHFLPVSSVQLVLQGSSIVGPTIGETLQSGPSHSPSLFDCNHV